SVFLQVAHVANKKKQPLLTMLGLFFTLVLGILFCIYQIQGWQQLTDTGIYLSFNPNPAGPFFYVITFLHAAHLAFGLLFLLVAFAYSIYQWRKPSQEINSNTGILTIRTDLLTLFWHFMGILWVYLYFFLSYNLK
ncbi:MAG TPA: cytochrome c oxidase subunit 3, partial [Chitinophagales bacterium]|nr:cytochrome c oxidase subunit 3 [Chitinophagales bacterium]